MRILICSTEAPNLMAYDQFFMFGYVPFIKTRYSYAKVIAGISPGFVKFYNYFDAFDDVIINPIYSHEESYINCPYQFRGKLIDNNAFPEFDCHFSSISENHNMFEIKHTINKDKIIAEFKEKIRYTEPGICFVNNVPFETPKTEIPIYKLAIDFGGNTFYERPDGIFVVPAISFFLSQHLFNLTISDLFSAQTLLVQSKARKIIVTDKQCNLNSDAHLYKLSRRYLGIEQFEYTIVKQLEQDFLREEFNKYVR